MTEKLAFEPLYYKERLDVINPYGTIGVVTLWSKPDIVRARLSDCGVDLSENSLIAVIGTLFGGGLKQLLRNLLNNPQIDTLLLYGADLGDSAKLLKNFFYKGLEEISTAVEYSDVDLQQVKTCRVVDSSYIMDDLVKPEMFSGRIEIIHFEDRGEEGAKKLAAWLQTCLPKIPRPHIEARSIVPIPEMKRMIYPSDPAAHAVVENTTIEAWREIVSRIFRFGERVQLAKGERVELRNLKAIIKSPDLCVKELEKEGFHLEEVKRYQKEILSPDDDSDQPYTYGNRLRGYFKRGDGEENRLDSLDVVAEQLKINDLADGTDKNPDSRQGFISLWDPTRDLEAGENRPCMTSVFVRKINKQLELTAVFRTHNASRAWLYNVCSLWAIMDYLCDKTRATPGSITVFSHSISLDPNNALEIGKKVYEERSKKNRFREDPNGHLIIRVEDGEIVVEHCYSGIPLGVYRARKPGTLQHELVRNHVISDIAHAVYIGMQLEKAYWCIQENVPYIQTDDPGKPKDIDRC